MFLVLWIQQVYRVAEVLLCYYHGKLDSGLHCIFSFFALLIFTKIAMEKVTTVLLFCCFIYASKTVAFCSHKYSTTNVPCFVLVESGVRGFKPLVGSKQQPGKAKRGKGDGLM